MKEKVRPILMGGIIATAAMTVFMPVAPYLRMPKMLIGKMLAGFMHLPIFMGWILHFIIGTILATMFVLVWEKRLPGNAPVKGMFFSLIPFLVAQTVAMPVMGAGFFFMNSPAPAMMVISSLLGHLVYGGVLGIVTEKAGQ